MLKIREGSLRVDDGWQTACHQNRVASGDVTISLSGEKRGTPFCDLSIIQN